MSNCAVKLVTYSLFDISVGETITEYVTVLRSWLLFPYW